ncbi:MAG: hypothetical protein Kow0069_01450 [Promethearchaeota archaeon]
MNDVANWEVVVDASVQGLLNSKREDYSGLMTHEKSVRTERTYSKRDAVGNLHVYWSKKPHALIRQYVEAFSRPGDVVFDPFLGSGATALAALSTGRKFVGGDLSHAATFVARATIRPVDLEKLKEAHERLARAVERRINELYLTRCRECGHWAAANYFRWEKVFACECGVEVRLSSPPTCGGGARRPSRCPSCSRPFRARKALVSKELLVGVHYSCQNCGSRNLAAEPTSDDVQVASRVSRKEILDADPLAAQSLPKNSQIGVVGDDETLLDMFTPRTWRSLRILHAGIAAEADPALREQLTLAFTSVLYNCSKMAQDNPRGGGIAIKGTLYRPPFFRERNPWVAFNYKFTRHTLPGKRAVASLLPAGAFGNCAIMTRPAQDYGVLPDESVDYAFTDPPYGESVPYLEVNRIMTAWLGKVDDVTREIVVTRRANDPRGRDSWLAGIREAFSEVYRVLKPGRWLTITFRHKDPKAWALLDRTIQGDLFAGGRKVGFVRSPRVATISGRQLTYKQLTSKKTVRGDAVVNYLKPAGKANNLTHVYESSLTPAGTSRARSLRA